MKQQHWNKGYITDIPYIEAFFSYMSPTILNFAAACMGGVGRDLSGDFTYLELGCGFGLSTTTYAGCFPKGQFYAVDFNPAHIDHAVRQASRLGIDNVHFLERSFEQVLDEPLPDFDYIVLHGIWSWVNADMRNAICRIIEKKLKPGGLVYISYNCLPGWAPEAPLRKWLYEFGTALGSDSLSGIKEGLRTLQQAKTVKDGYFRNNLDPVLASFEKKEPRYLAGEYMNEEWHLDYSVDVADAMASAKLSFVGSATLAENFQELILSKEGMDFVRDLNNTRLRQLAEDFLAMRRFRRDVFVRGNLPQRHRSLIRNIRDLPVGSFILAKNLPDSVQMPRGTVKLEGPGLDIIRDALKDGPRPIGDILDFAPQEAKAPDLLRMLIILLSGGKLLPFASSYRSPPIPAEIRKASWPSPINRAIAQSVLADNRRGALVSPVIGNGYEIDPSLAALVGVLDGSENGEGNLAARVKKSLDSHGIIMKTQGAEQEGMAQVVEQHRTQTLPSLAQLGLLHVE
ncbi:MAG TPA: class I SAM-dependent methyltransferase [Dongiaceae bacterium]|nr:class I SAM-dependent methyltransferase [Dongiaceae bacterium]